MRRESAGHRTPINGVELCAFLIRGIAKLGSSFWKIANAQRSSTQVKGRTIMTPASHRRESSARWFARRCAAL